MSTSIGAREAAAGSGRQTLGIWIPVAVLVAAGSMAMATVPQAVPILGALAQVFHANDQSLGWIVSFPSVACALGALAFGIAADRVGEIKLLLLGVALLILGDLGAVLAPDLGALFGARLFQGVGYASVIVAAPSLIQRKTAGDTRRAAMALWSAHPPAGFAVAIFMVSQAMAAGLSWRWSFLGHAGAAALVAVAVLAVVRAPAGKPPGRAAHVLGVLSSGRVYAVAAGTMGSAMLQTGLMVLLPSYLAQTRGFTAQESALVIVAAMIANFSGALVIVTTRIKDAVGRALPITALAAALLAIAILMGGGLALPVLLTVVLLFTAAVGAANSLVWSLLPGVTPSPQSAGATAGFVTQGSFAGVLLGPPAFFAAHQSHQAWLGAAICLSLGLIIMSPLLTPRRPGSAEPPQAGPVKPV